MGIAIFVAVIVIIFAITYGIIDEEPGMAFGISLAGLLFGVLVFLICSLWSDRIPQEECIINEINVPIVALQDNMAVDGNFILGCGGVKGEMYYYFMRNTDKGYQMDSIKASTVYICETNDIQPHYSIFRIAGFKHWWTYILNTPGICINRTLYVPTNTIYQAYNIDMK